MKPIRATYTTTGAQAWIPLNPHISPFSVSCFTEGGTAGDIEYTVDPLQDSSVTPAVAGTVSSNLLSTPATGVRLNVTAATVVFKVLQAGMD